MIPTELKDSQTIEKKLNDDDDLELPQKYIQRFFQFLSFLVNLLAELFPGEKLINLSTDKKLITIHVLITTCKRTTCEPKSYYISKMFFQKNSEN